MRPVYVDLMPPSYPMPNVAWPTKTQLILEFLYVFLDAAGSLLFKVFNVLKRR